MTSVILRGASTGELGNLFCANPYRLFRNGGARNAAHDNFVVAELSSLPEGGAFFASSPCTRTDARVSRLAVHGTVEGSAAEALTEVTKKA